MTTNRLAAALVAFFAIAALSAIVLIAIGADRLWSLIGGIAVFGAIIVTVLLVIVLLIRVASIPLARIWDARLAIQKESNRHDEKYLEHGYVREGAGYKPFKQIAAPKAERQPEPIDPRHELLISLCLLTIRADGYGPTSERLMTADDAQSRGGRFADRNNWDAASKYGQSIGVLYTQVGGKPADQGLKVNNHTVNGGRTVTDLLETLHARNVIRDSAVSALPEVVR